MKRIAIISGGICGLSAAFTLEERRRTRVPLEYVLYESSSRLGGVISTERVDGCVVEAGPDSFLTEKPWAADLCRELGLGDQLIGSNDAERKTYILLKGRLVPIPDGLMFMVPTRILPVVFSPLFSPVTKFRMVREWFQSPASSDQDESVAEFVERHWTWNVEVRIPTVGFWDEPTLANTRVRHRKQTIEKLASRYPDRTSSRRRAAVVGGVP